MCADALAYMEDMDILFGGYWIESPLNSILIDIYGDQSECAFCFSSTTSGGSLYVLGTNFLQYYYTVLDIDN